MDRAATSMAETAREGASTGKAAMGQKAVMAAASTDAAVSIITKTAAAITAGRIIRAPMNRISSRISEKATKGIAWIRKPPPKGGGFCDGRSPLFSGCNTWLIPRFMWLNYS